MKWRHLPGIKNVVADYLSRFGLDNQIYLDDSEWPQNSATIDMDAIDTRHVYAIIRSQSRRYQENPMDRSHTESQTTFIAASLAPTSSAAFVTTPPSTIATTPHSLSTVTTTPPNSTTYPTVDPETPPHTTGIISSTDDPTTPSESTDVSSDPLLKSDDLTNSDLISSPRILSTADTIPPMLCQNHSLLCY